MTKRVLFLDRDGTLNRTTNGRPPNVPAKVQLLPGVADVLSRYVAEGWLLAIISNQGGVASGYLSLEQAQAVQRRVIDLLRLPIAADYLCPHMPGARIAEYDTDCPNRKPRPGFIYTALQALEAEPGDCLFVGDAITDLQAAQAAGVPFRWADRFFGRPIDRGLQTRDGHWLQMQEDATTLPSLICRARGNQAVGPLDRALERLEAWPQKMPPENRDLVLVGRQDDQIAGWLLLLRGRARETAHSADLVLVVERAYQGVGIEALLMQTGTEWARPQDGLNRICVRVPVDDVPFAELCCRFGFAEEKTRDPAADEADPVTMVCYQ